MRLSPYPLIVAAAIAVGVLASCGIVSAFERIAVAIAAVQPR